MKPTPDVQWQQTTPGIWTPVPEAQLSPRKGPARQITSLLAHPLAHPLPPTNHRQPRKHRLPPGTNPERLWAAPKANPAATVGRAQVPRSRAAAPIARK